MSENEITVNAVLVEEETVPCEKAPVCTRELFLRPPDWRYQEAVKYLEEEEHGRTPVIPTDVVVQYVIRFLRAVRHPENRIYTDIVWPHMSEVIELGTISKHSAIVAEIENCIIRGKTPSQVRAAGFFVPAHIYEMYGKIFFDLSGITAIHAWMNDFLFEPEKNESNTILLRSRLMSYYGESEAGLKSSITGMSNDSEKKTMDKIVNTERQRKVFDYVTKNTRMDRETYINIMEAAVKSMTERDFQEHMKDLDSRGSESLESLAANLEQGIRAFSQQELEQTSTTGLDFTNQYLSAILQKDK